MNRIVYKKGGSNIIHALPPDTMRAVCGQEPKGKPGTTHTARAGWRLFPSAAERWDEIKHRYRACPKCFPGGVPK